MSDTYEIDGVKITPTSGGYYDINHATMSEPERVRGKDKAEQRAKEIAAAAATPEGSIQAQGTTIDGGSGQIIKPGDDRNSSERVQEMNAGIEQREGEARRLTEVDKQAETDAVNNDTLNRERAPQDGSGVAPDDKDAKIKALEAALAAANGEKAALDDRMSNIEALLNKVTTVATTDEPMPQVNAAIPRAYTGQMDAKTKAMIRKAGFEVHTIVLEENESIPPTGLFVSHNGKAYMIKPGEEVDVPDFLLGVLDDAVMSAPIVDSASQKVLGYRNRSKYPYRNITK